MRVYQFRHVGAAFFVVLLRCRCNRGPNHTGLRHIGQGCFDVFQKMLHFHWGLAPKALSFATAAIAEMKKAFICAERDLERVLADEGFFAEFCGAHGGTRTPTPRGTWT
jgi:hypothetical protein